MRHATIFLLLAALVAAPAARADRPARGFALHRERCALCHDLGWRAAAADGARPAGRDLVAMSRGLRADELRRWMEAPQAVRPDTRCLHAPLRSDEIDALVRLLAVRAATRGPVVTAPAPPANPVSVFVPDRAAPVALPAADSTPAMAGNGRQPGGNAAPSPSDSAASHLGRALHPGGPPNKSPPLTALRGAR